jgi:hypothetical protein
MSTRLEGLLFDEFTPKEVDEFKIIFNLFDAGIIALLIILTTLTIVVIRLIRFHRRRGANVLVRGVGHTSP